MFEKTVETSATSRIVVTECLGALTVRGEDQQAITLKVLGSEDDVRLDREEGVFTLEAHAGCTLACPPGAALTVQKVSGNLSVEGVEGALDIGVVQGNLSLHTVGSVDLEQVLGNLNARQVVDLQGQDMKGNVRSRDVEGPLSLGEVSGNLVVEGLSGGLMVDRVRGNARLGPPFSPGATYRVNTGGNLTLLLPRDASLQLALRAGGGVRSRLPDLALKEVDDMQRGTLGAGEATLEAEADGYIYLRPENKAESFSFSADLEELGVQIEAQIHRAMAEVASRLEESLGRIDSDSVRHRMDRVTEKAGKAAERAAEQARRRAEREAERARLRAESAERRWQRISGQQPASETATTDEERMRVLRMVEEGKITPEQASDLLAALEGR
jgi:hypothetical protein